MPAVLTCYNKCYFYLQTVSCQHPAVSLIRLPHWGRKNSALKLSLDSLSLLFLLICIQIQFALRSKGTKMSKPSLRKREWTSLLIELGEGQSCHQTHDEHSLSSLLSWGGPCGHQNTGQIQSGLWGRMMMFQDL